MGTSTSADTDIDRRFRDAVELHQRGDITKALAIYDDLLHSVPSHPELLHLVGTALVQIHRAAEAIVPLEKSLALRPKYAPTLEMAGTALLLSGQPQRALPLLSDAAALQPHAAGVHLRLGDAFLATGRYTEAQRAFETARTLAPQRPEAHVGWANALAHLGEVGRATTALQDCAAAHPGFAPAHVMLATLLGQQQQFAAAEHAARAALVLRQSPDVYHLLAKVLRRQGKWDDACHAYEDALAAERVPALATEYAELLIDQGKLDDAERILREAPDTGPATSATLTALGRVHELRGQLTDSLALHDRALTLDPNNANACVNRGTAKRFAGDVDGALADFDRALVIAPNLPYAVASRGITLLTEGRLAEGWPLFKARLRARDGEPDFSAGVPWDGAPLDGRRILVWTEQGVGDEIMAASLLPDLIARTAHCTVLCSSRLVGLLRRAFPSVTVLDRAEPVTGDFDARLPLLDAALWLRPDFGAFPARTAYLQTDDDAAAKLRRRYGTDKPLVGISWRSTAHTTGPFKTTPLAAWKSILQVPGLRFVSLQYDTRPGEIEQARAATGAEIVADSAIDYRGDLDPVAAQVAAMDLVITASNTAVHLAGALGKPEWLLAPEGPGALWYWFTRRSDSPWYPTVSIIRQARAGDWAPVFAAVTDRLQQWKRA